MKPEIKTKWADALRSGTYVQGKHSLRIKSADPHIPDSFCCLGVLCDIVNPDKWVFALGSSLDYEFDGLTGDLSDQTRVLAGIPPDDHFAVIGSDPVYHLIQLNDQEGKSFAQIADYIEENL